MKRIRDFQAATDDPRAARLREQLISLEGNVSDALDTLGQAKMARLEVKAREQQGSGLTVSPGQSLGIVSTVARIDLDTPRPGDAGTFIAICKGAGAASNTDLVPSGARINGATSFTIATSGLLQLVYCDGVDYWTAP